MNTKFLLLHGPSGVGKTTIIQHLRAIDPRFEYIKPLITRPLRPGEQDKVSVSEEEADRLERSPGILSVNRLFGVRYITLRQPIDAAFETGRMPVLDWPIARLEIMEVAYPDRLFRVYIEPPSLQQLRQRLSDGRDPNDARLAYAVSELDALQKGAYDGVIDYRLVNQDGQMELVAEGIYERYLRA